MTVLQALRDATGALGRNPVIVGVMFVIALLQIPSQLVPASEPLLSALVSLGFMGVMIVVFPFVFGGLYGMADEALAGRTSLSTFVAEGKRNYKSMFGAFLLIFGASFVFGIVVSIGTFLVLVLVLGMGGLAGGGMALTGIVLVGVIVALLFFVPMFFVQFYGQAIVIDDAGAIGGFKRSVSVVRRNLLSVFGYSVLVFGVGLVFGLIAAVPMILLNGQQTGLYDSMLPELSTGALVGLLGLFVIVTSVLSALFLTFSVAFYRRISDSSARDGEPTAGSTPA